jgi:hypothetical protein
MPNNDILRIAAITAETGCYLVFTQMKKTVTTGLAILTVAAQTPHTHALSNIPVRRYGLAFTSDMPDNFMSWNAWRV